MTFLDAGTVSALLRPPTNSISISMSGQPFVNLDHLETLLDLDRRHETLLAELDALDRRVCEVLGEVRAAFQPEAPEPHAEG